MLLKSIKDFIALDHKGWLLGPQEEEKDYFARIEALKKFATQPLPHMDNFLTDTDWEMALQKTQTLYDLAPDWIVAYYSNKNLSFFQGAATWIDTRGPLPIPYIQLKEKCASGTLFSLYKREEILAHEIVHATRMMYNEAYFEEFFAYRTSPHLFRRFLGPLFQYPWEGYVFIALLFVPIALVITSFFYFDLGPITYLRFAPLLFFTYLFVRLLVLHSVLHQALHKMAPLLKNPDRKWAFAVRLTDKEIFQAAFRTKILLKKKASLRWQVLKEYLK